MDLQSAVWPIATFDPPILSPINLLVADIYYNYILLCFTNKKNLKFNSKNSQRLTIYLLDILALLQLPFIKAKNHNLFMVVLMYPYIWLQHMPRKILHNPMENLIIQEEEILLDKPYKIA